MPIEFRVARELGSIPAVIVQKGVKMRSYKSNSLRFRLEPPWNPRCPLEELLKKLSPRCRKGVRRKKGDNKAPKSCLLRQVPSPTAAASLPTATSVSIFRLGCSTGACGFWRRQLKRALLWPFAKQVGESLMWGTKARPCVIILLLWKKVMYCGGNDRQLTRCPFIPALSLHMDNSSCSVTFISVVAGFEILRRDIKLCLERTQSYLHNRFFE